MREPQLYSINNCELWGQRVGAPAMASGAWTTANLAVFTPVYVPHPMLIASLWFFNGDAVADNWDVGLYAPDANGKPGTRIASIGGVVQSGVNQLQKALLGSRVMVGGLVYLAASKNGTSGTCRTLGTLAANLTGPVLGGTYTQAAAYPLPATATPNGAGVATVVPVLMGAAS